MTVRTLLTLSSFVMFVTSLTFLIYPDYITLQIYPEASEIEFQIAVIHRQMISGFCFFIGILIFLARKNVSSAAKRILFGTSLGFLILAFFEIKFFLFDNISIYWPITVTFFTLGILSFYVSYLKKH
jgi:hypothetical protein